VKRAARAARTHTEREEDCATDSARIEEATITGDARLALRTASSNGHKADRA
jgi:hypothetical protein